MGPMERPKLEVADIFRRYGEAYRQKHGASLSTAQRRVMTAIEVCRTAALGGHLEHCDSCPFERPCYDSCRDRHCPKCQSLARAEWLEKRKASRHTIFTSSSRSPNKSRLWLTRTKISSTAFCSEPRPRPCAPSLPIPNIWAPRSVSSLYCTVGDRTCSFIPTCIVSFRVAGSPPTVPVGFLAAPISSCPYGCCPGSSAECS